MSEYAIWKFTLGIQDHQRLMVPATFVPLHVGMQHGQLCLWAKVDPVVDETLGKVERWFRIYGTGHPVPEKCGTYIGTAIDEEAGFVWHLFMEDPA